VTITLVMARESIPVGPPSVFLAGPTHPDPAKSWRPAMIAALDRQWDHDRGQLTVLTPESRGGQRARRYRDQFEWEVSARRQASAVLFWIPRDVTELPGFTTNVEFGVDVGTGRAVLGCPPDCPSPERNRYLVHLAQLYGVPVSSPLAGTVTNALQLITKTD
jgi:Nucleoside 2-deoxyribosyltransferase like